jgi:hypothetical protein
MEKLIFLVIAVAFAVWVYRIAKGREKNPLVWAIFTVFIWPIPVTIIGVRYRRWVLVGLGLIGLYLLSTFTLFAQALLTTPGYDGSISSLIWDAARRGMPLAVLLLISMVLIAQRGGGLLYRFIHGFVAFNIIELLVYSYISKHLIHVLPEAVGRGLALGFLALGTLATGLIILWVGFIFSDKTTRRPFLKWFVIFSIASVVCYFLSSAVFSLFAFSGNQLPSDSSLAFARTASTLVASLPCLTLLFGIIKSKALIAMPPLPISPQAELTDEPR